MDITEKLIRIADASKHADGTDIPLGEQVREAAATIADLRRRNEMLARDLNTTRAAWQQDKDGLSALLKEAEEALAVAERVLGTFGLPVSARVCRSTLSKLEAHNAE